MRHAPPVLAAAAAVVALAALAAGCGDDDQGDTATFCAEVKANQTELITPPQALTDVPAYVDLYRKIDKVAPLAIELHWKALVLNYETASTVDTGDPESVQRAYARAYQTEDSAVAVHDFLLTNCSVDLGPVTTIVPHAPAAPAATMPPTTGG